MRRMQLWLGAMVVMLAACAQIGIPTPDTFNQRLAAGYATTTAVRQTATDLLKAKKIDVADAENVLKSTDAARTGLDVARTLAKTNLAAADSKVSAIHTVLTALSTYLAGRK